MSDRQNPVKLDVPFNQIFQAGGTLNADNQVDVFYVELNEDTEVLLEAGVASGEDGEEPEIQVNFAVDQDNDSQFDSNEIFFFTEVESDDQTTLFDQVIPAGRYFVEAQLLNPSEASANYSVDVLLGGEVIEPEEPDEPEEAGNNPPDNLQFGLNQDIYTPGDTLSLVEAWVRDSEDYGDLARADFWLLTPGGEWQDLQDVTEFTPWSESFDWASFQYSLDLSGYEPGQYAIWAQVSDITGATSNQVQIPFTIESEIAPANAPPTGLQFGLNQTTFSEDDTLFLSEAWIQDGNGTEDLASVELWLLDPEGNWSQLAQITDFTAWSVDDSWASFGYSTEIADDRQSGSYLLWMQGYDLAGEASDAVTARFEIVSEDIG